MIQNTFVHIPGISKVRENLIWENQIYTWNQFKCSTKQILGPKLTQVVHGYLAESFTSFQANDFYYFYSKLPSNESWRLFPHIQSNVAYIDIETTGHLNIGNHITTICLYDGTNLYSYVRGENLYQFCKDITHYQTIVTYNGKSFDVPFIEHEFQMKIKAIHLDVMHFLRALGIRGGLKNCEKQLGIHRGDLLDVDGYDAVLLWHKYQSTKKQKFLETLLAYNAYDAIHLEQLMIEVYKRYTKNLPFQVPTVQLPKQELKLPFQPHLSAIYEIRDLRNTWF
ncbi:MAG: ribonuclease H-like domain-containing protein [bacterium]|nr:ribonuclease H-like domain-containing protein [bacterium]